MRIELTQGDEVVEVELAPGEHTVGGSDEDGLCFPGLAPAEARLRVEPTRLCFLARRTLAVDGVFVPAGVWRMLLEGEALELAPGISLRHSEETVAERAGAQPTSMVFRELLGGRDVGGARLPSLTCLTGLDMGRVYPLADGQSVVGRGVEAEVRIRDRATSRRHARLSSGDEGYVLEDLGGPNGVFVNGRALSGPRALRHGDVIELGRTLLRVGMPAEGERADAADVGTPRGEAAATLEDNPAADVRRASHPVLPRGAGEWALIGVGAGLTLMGALMTLGVLA